MKNYFAIILFITLSFPQNDFSKIFGSDYKDALHFLKSKKERITLLTKKYGGESKLIIPVIFPELIRFSVLSDLFEIGALEIIYVDKGCEAADFSIGRFQMKPSFVENIENAISKMPDVNIELKQLIHYSETDLRKIRSKRIKRMKSFDWQVIYLICFEKVVKVLFKNHNFKSFEDKIKFFATAYNYGYNKSVKNIEHWQNKKIFPYGSNFIGNQYAYSEIALFFYKNDFEKIFS